MQIYTKARKSSEPNQRELENRRVAYDAACEGMVLLKNDGALPFVSKKVALYGAGAAKTVKGGTGSGEVNERYSVTILEGLENRGFTVTTHDWIDRYEAAFVRAEREDRESKKRAILKPSEFITTMFAPFDFRDSVPVTEQDLSASDTDSCVYVISRQAGEGGDRRVEKGDYLLTDAELANIRTCAAYYSKFLLVINCGSSIDMSFVEQIPQINAIVYLCQLGTEGGNAFADVLSGKVTPSGHLTDTWAKSYADIPFSADYSILNGNTLEEYYREDIYVGYRYYDSFGVTPAYPFGFGLSYTSFDIHSSGVQMDGRMVIVQASVANTGDTYAGKAVAQLYVSAPNGALHKEYQSLMAFAKTRKLAPKERETLTLTFDLSAMASYREADASYVLEAGDYLLRLGDSSRNTLVIGAVTVANEIIVSKHDAICPLREKMDTLVAPPRAEEVLAPGLPRLYADEAAFPCICHHYETPAECANPWVEQFLSKLSLSDMAEIVVGIGMFTGERRFDLPGSVGNTTSKFWDRGLANVALCDGPAGLRIQKRSTLTSSGKIKAVELAMTTYEALPGFVKKILTGDPEKGTDLYQFTTAFPVTAALAQSWNTELMYRVGTAIYREMREYGCTFWLAPAINIHRNPLCGRNFEYYSEDPRLTGLMATALTQGVQQEDGYCVTAKHFACNNQEENRNYVSSNLTERALREIYLRAFELTVKDGGAKSIMTSYNRVNGVWSPNSYDLCTKVLRNEWGFTGVVMTDWFSTGGNKASNALCMRVGNDLIMPGSTKAKREILKAIKSGTISEADLRRCCANVVRAILESPTQREYIG